jgi:uncharacterized protein YutE (UPF0331/DUF86 family)
MPNWEIIEQHIQNMEEALAQLSKYKNISLEEFQKDLGLIWIVEEGLEILIQNLLDMGGHLLASEIKNDWEDYGEVISKLGQHGIIPKEFSERIKEMAGLRNILIHEYLKIDLSKLFDYLEYRLEDFIQFVKYIREYKKSLVKR